jgi:hypothetical protein
MLLMTGNTRSGGVGQGRAFFARRASGQSALTDAGAEGIRPRMLKGFVLLWFPFSNCKVAVQEPKSSVFLLAS